MLYFSRFFLYSYLLTRVKVLNSLHCNTIAFILLLLYYCTSVDSDILIQCYVCGTFVLIQCVYRTVYVMVKKVKQSRYRPGVTQRVPGR